VLQTIVGSILDVEDLGRRSPEVTISLRSANKVFLVIDRAEDNVAAGACEENRGCLEGGPYDGISGEVLGLEGVNSRQPCANSPVCACC
jgi:hypothetical protein